MLKDVSIEIIQRCNNHCVHCSSCSTEESTMILSLDVITRVVDGLVALGVERVCLSGGEPFLHPKIKEIVETICKCGMTADIYTSGVIGTKDSPIPLSKEMLSELKSIGLHALLFNLQSATEATYDLITQSNGHFPTVCESITNSVKCGIKTEIHFVPMKINLEDAEAVVRFAEKVGVEQVNFLKLVPHGRAKENIAKISPTDTSLQSMLNRLIELKEQGKHIRLGLPLSDHGNAPPCHAVNEKLYIKFDGSVFGCEAFKYISFVNDGHLVEPDSIYSKRIEEIYRDSSYLKYSIALVKSFEELQVSCENCPVQKYLKRQEVVQ